jgi:hypothetical protein
MVKQVASVSELSPDGSGRFLMMSSLLEAFYGKSSKKVEILDVGGSSPFMSRQLANLSPRYNLTAIDILPKPEKFHGNYIQGDATNMDFDDDMFDTVISTDVLEHIPPEKKEAFVREAIRAARSFVIIAAPFNTAGVEEAERATNDFNKILFDEGQPWLEEHFEYKKPELSLVNKITKELKYESITLGTNNLYSWLLSTHLNLLEAKLGLGQREHIKINKLLNQKLLQSGDMAGPFYRHFVVIFKKSPSKEVLHSIKTLQTPTDMDQGAILRYFHDLMGLVAKRIQTADYATIDVEKRVTQLQAEVHAANERIRELEAVVERCRPYLSLLDLHPRAIVHKLKNRK